MAPEMPSGHVELRRHGLARAADLPLHRQPPGVADRPRGRQLGAERRGQLLAPARCSPGPLMPRPTATMRSACDRSTACLASWNGGFRLLPDGRASTVTASARHRRRRVALDDRVGAERADLEGHEVRAWPSAHACATSLPWNIGRAKAGPAALRLERRAVGDERAPDPRGQLRHEVARLVGVRQHDALRTQRLETAPAARASTSRRRVRLERRVARRSAPQPPPRPPVRLRPPGRRGRPSTATFDRLAAGHLLGGGNGLPRGAIELFRPAVRQ